MKKVQTGFLSAILANHHSLTQHAHHTHTHPCTHVHMHTCTRAHTHNRHSHTHCYHTCTFTFSVVNTNTRTHKLQSFFAHGRVDFFAPVFLFFLSLPHHVTFPIMSLSFSLLFLYLSCLFSLPLLFCSSHSHFLRALSLSFFLNSSFSKQKLTGSQANLNRYFLQNDLFAVLVKVWFYSMILYELIRHEL